MIKKNLFFFSLLLFLFGCLEGEIGPDGLTSLLETTIEPAGVNCDYEGLKVITGKDINANGVLDEDEILQTEYVCGVAGLNTLVNVSDEPSGSNCGNGGVKIDSGIDTNRDGVLEEGEIQVSRYVCRGEIGPDGLVSLVETIIEPAGENCEFEGIKVNTGIDNNADGILDPEEILQTEYVCGVAGNNTLINVSAEPVGIICTNGGVKVDSGVDLDRDGLLDIEEIQTTRYICNGIDGGFDEQISFFLLSNTGNNGTTPIITAAGLPFFDIRNYSDVDSAVFVVSGIETSESTFPFADIAGSGTFELYDMTNDQVIANSAITSDDIPENSFVASVNIINNLPQSSVKLGVQLTSGGAFNSRCENIYLILYRN